MERAGSSQEPSNTADLAEREREATTKETLKEIVDKEKSSKRSDESNNNPPSPDGAFDENRELKESDPM